jgi:hypothetical protein
MPVDFTSIHINALDKQIASIFDIQLKTANYKALAALIAMSSIGIVCVIYYMKTNKIDDGKREEDFEYRP